MGKKKEPFFPFQEEVINCNDNMYVRVLCAAKYFSITLILIGFLFIYILVL